MSWAQPEEFNIERKKDHATFYCPNGHGQCYPGKSDIETLEENLANVKSELHRVKYCAEEKKRKITALKGVITKMKKR
jgi:hypothetical protein